MANFPGKPDSRIGPTIQKSKGGGVKKPHMTSPTATFPGKKDSRPSPSGNKRM